MLFASTVAKRVGGKALSTIFEIHSSSPSIDIYYRTMASWICVLVREAILILVGSERL